MTMSQGGDGWDDEIFDTDEGDDGTSRSKIEEQAHSDGTENRRQAKAKLTALFYSTMNSIDLADPLMVKSLEKILQNFKSESRVYYESTMENSCVDDGLTRFPNTKFGNKTIDRITKP